MKIQQKLHFYLGFIALILLLISNPVQLFAQKEEPNTATQLQIDSLEIDLQKNKKNQHDLQIRAKITQLTPPKTNKTDPQVKRKTPVKKDTLHYLINTGIVLSFIILSILFIVAMLKLATYSGYIPSPPKSKKETMADEHKRKSKDGIESKKVEIVAEPYEVVAARARIGRVRRVLVICVAFFLELLILQDLFFSLVEFIIKSWNEGTSVTMVGSYGNSLKLDITDAERIINGILVIIPFLFTAYLLDMFLNFFVWFNILLASPDEGLPPGESKVPKLIRILASVLIYLISLIVIAAVLYPHLLFSLVASIGASGAIGAFLAKEPVKKAFTALSLNMNKQFRRGDLIEIEGLKGRISDIGWRAIKLTSAEGNEIVIPNTTLLESNVIEYPHRTIRLTVPIHADLPPQVARDLLFKSIYSSDLVLNKPAANINVIDFQEGQTIYSIEVYSKNDNEDLVRGEILSSIWYMLRREELAPSPLGFEIENPETLARELIDNVEVEITDDETNTKKIVKIFDPFSDEDVQEIAKKAKFLRFGYPERVVIQGDNDTDLYIVAEGTLQLFLRQTDGKNQAIMIPTKEGKMKPLEFRYGNFFGEMSLLGGEPRSATVKAMNDVLVCQISQATLKPIIEKNPDIIKELSEILTERKMENLKRSADYSKSLAETQKQKEAILKAIGSAMLSIFVEDKPKKKKDLDED